MSVSTVFYVLTYLVILYDVLIPLRLNDEDLDATSSMATIVILSILFFVLLLNLAIFSSLEMSAQYNSKLSRGLLGGALGADCLGLLAVFWDECFSERTERRLG